MMTSLDFSRQVQERVVCANALLARGTTQRDHFEITSKRLIVAYRRFAQEFTTDSMVALRDIFKEWREQCAVIKQKHPDFNCDPPI